MALKVACHLNILLPGVGTEQLPGTLETIAGLGYSHIALPPLDVSNADIDRLAGLFAESGLAPITLAGQHPGADVSSPDPAVRAEGLKELKAAVDLTSDLGGAQMNGVPYGPFGHAPQPVDDQTRHRSARAVGEVADYAQSKGVAMNFEVLNRYETCMVNTAEQALEFVELSGSENLRIHLDTFHMSIEEPEIEQAIRLALPKLGYLELGQAGRGSLLHGHLDCGSIISAAAEAGYEGVWGIEAFTRSVLEPEAANMLAIWRETYSDGTALAREALELIRSNAGG